ncbi:AraC family transcriptional regulator [Sedimentitalea todarodis]|uniref:Helix-turn-helix domain-containing protein n=1 Tax=Sedimentitalea todarodis TaxID=1631240 RepID=A0ABU3VMJ5_9RHOB|nr:helix-turn-helix domain-containing protein [Sedimentitalea todarodis]MDU9007195.1 helix-turn-helix domain-containing protein [Sedimentitalea todarodis]
MGKLNVVVAQAIKPVLGAVPMSKFKLELFAERAGLPASTIEDPTGFVPLNAVESFLNSIHKEVGDPTFLFDSLDIDITEKRETHAVVGVPLPTGVTGQEALQIMSATFNRFITGPRYMCETRGNRLWVLRTTSATDWSDNWSVVQYNLSIMLQGARRILGQNVTPVALCLPDARRPDKLPEEFCNLPISRNRDRFGIAFSIVDVASAKFVLEAAENPSGGHLTEPMSDTTFQTIASCLSKFVMSSTSDRLSERVAKAFGFSTRSYRRQLANLGTSHTQLLADVRLDLALTLLALHSISITEIAYELGYAHPGDFTRFFKARMGCSPLEFRQRRSQTKPIL